MRMIRPVALLIGLLLCAAASPPCAGDACVALAGGTYRIAVPPGWNHRDRLPLLIFMHGHGATGTDMLVDPDFFGPPARLGFLMVAPDGVDGDWTVGGGSRRQGRDDIGFLRVVLADVRQRFPIDDRLVVAGGFSLGGSMVWELACHTGHRDFTAFLSFSAALWEPLPERCEGGPVDLRHVHGRTDPQVPVEGGRVFANGAVHAAMARSMALLRATDHCREAPDRHTMEDKLACDVWSSCAEERQIRFCLHPGGHYLDGAWLEGGLRWAMGLAGVAAP